MVRVLDDEIRSMTERLLLAATKVTVPQGAEELPEEAMVRTKAGLAEAVTLSDKLIRLTGRHLRVLYGKEA